MIVRKFLFLNEFRYRLHNKSLPGKPDLSNIKSNPHESNTWKDSTPKIAVRNNDQTVKGNLFIDIPFVRKFNTVTI